jgi:hypothetical protein
MRQTTRLEVVADGARWNITERGIGRLSSYPTKVAATAAAQAMARLHTPSELIIRNDNGTIDAQHNYEAPKPAR